MLLSPFTQAQIRHKPPIAIYSGSACPSVDFLTKLFFLFAVLKKTLKPPKQMYDIPSKKCIKRGAHLRGLPRMIFHDSLSLKLK